jgi:Uma2 family endonuclease
LSGLPRQVGVERSLAAVLAGRSQRPGPEESFDFASCRNIITIMKTATLPRPEATRRWTYEEMAAELPESNLPTELWDGEIIRSAAPPPRHQIIAAHVWDLLNRHVKAQRLGQVLISPVDVVFGARKAVQPDVLYVSAAKAAIIGEMCIRGVPDLLVEVISEGTWRRDRVDKKALYEQFCVSEYWIVDPDSRLIEVFMLREGNYALHARDVGAEQVGSKLLPGLTVTFDQLES